MREVGGRTVLLDFGLARSPDLEDPLLGGTPPFMAPEHVGRGEPGLHTDIYGLGATLYFLVSASYPYRGETAAEVVQQILNTQPTPLATLVPGIPGEFSTILEKAMSHAPEERHETAGHLERALREFVAQAPEPAARLDRRVIPSLLALVVLILVGAAWMVQGEEQLAVTAKLSRLSAEGQPLPLGEDSTVAVGDRLVLTAQGDEPFYLYVFNEDETGLCHTLYPRRQELLPAGMELRLPTDTTSWKVTSAGGVEHIFVIASREPDLFGDYLRGKIPLVSGPRQRVRISGLTADEARSMRRVSRGISSEVGEPGAIVTAAGDELEKSLADHFRVFAEHEGADPDNLVVQWALRHAE
jgi:hypothetical protein